MIKEQEMLEKELKENFEKDIDTIRNHITSLRLIGVGLSNTLNEKDKEIERLNNIIDKMERLIDNNGWNSYYYKCNGRYLKSEIINDMREIIDLKDSDKE